ncbi:MAG: hypothetical protein JO336_14060 [Acidobacteriia bacterium]|nr:hypothetical protein [Terriglobia bacterium]
MLAALFNRLFACTHKRLSRPLAPVRKGGKPQGESYVVCLDCGQRFVYDTKEWKVGGPLVDLPVGILTDQ